MTRCEAYLDSKGFLRWWSKTGEPETLTSPAEGVAAELSVLADERV